jgi:uncharacterized protein
MVFTLPSTRSSNMPRPSRQQRKINPLCRQTGTRAKPTQGSDMSGQNAAIAKKAYEAYGAGDLETALSTFDDDIEWSIPGNSTISGTYRGKGKFMELLGKLAEQSFTTMPDRILGDGDDVVVITKITAGGESALQADLLTYRNGKLVKALTIGDTAMQEKVYGRQ